LQLRLFSSHPPIQLGSLAKHCTSQVGLGSRFIADKFFRYTKREGVT
jgi:hypothetical protein